MQNVPKLLPKVLVIGGGTSGSTFAAYISSKKCVNTTLLKHKKPEIKNFPLWMWDDSLSVLRDLGLQERLFPMLSEIDSRHYFDHHGNSMTNTSLYAKSCIVPSNDLCKVMLELATKEGVEYKDCDLNVEELIYVDDKKVMATYDDKSTEIFDFVIGAEGVWRQKLDQTKQQLTRTLLYPNHKTFFPTPTVFLSTTIPPQFLENGLTDEGVTPPLVPPKEMWFYSDHNTGEQVSMLKYKCKHNGHNKEKNEYIDSYFLQFKVCAGSVEEAEAITETTSPELIALVNERFSGYGGAVPWALQGLANYMEDPLIRMGASVSPYVQTNAPWYENRVAIIGDAAHANCNWMDGAQGIDDAKALGDALVNSIDPEDESKFATGALRTNLMIFDAERQAKVKEVSLVSSREDPFALYNTGWLWKFKQNIYKSIDSLSTSLPMLYMMKDMIPQQSEVTLPTPSQDWFPAPSEQWGDVMDD